MKVLQRFIPTILCLLQTKKYLKMWVRCLVFLKLIINRPLWQNLRLNFDAQGNLANYLQIAKFKAINFELSFPKTTHLIERFRIISQNKTSSQIINRSRNIFWIDLQNQLEIWQSEFFNIVESSMVGEISWQDSKREFLLWSAH